LTVAAVAAAGAQVILLLQVLLEGAVGVGPAAEVMRLPVDLLAPVTGGVGGE
jgi:hypothetical protein